MCEIEFRYSWISPAFRPLGGGTHKLLARKLSATMPELWAIPVFSSGNDISCRDTFHAPVLLTDDYIIPLIFIWWDESYLRLGHSLALFFISFGHDGTPSLPQELKKITQQLTALPLTFIVVPALNDKLFWVDAQWCLSWRGVIVRPSLLSQVVCRYVPCPCRRL